MPEAKGRKARAVVGPPLFALAQRALFEQVAFILGSKVAAEGRCIFPVKPEDRSQSKDDANGKNESANDEQDFHEDIHLVLLCMDLHASQKGVWPRQQRTQIECQSPREPWLLNFAQVRENIGLDSSKKRGKTLKKRRFLPENEVKFAAYVY
jgi:hypothetical protein